MKKTIQLLMAGACVILAEQTLQAQWILGTNIVTATQSNQIGTNVSSAATRKQFNIATNSINRIAVDGTLFQTRFLGTTGLLINNVNTKNANITSSGDLGLFAANPFCLIQATFAVGSEPESASSSTAIPVPTNGPGDNIIMAGRNIYMQSKNIIPDGFGPVAPHRVFIGEVTTAAVSPATPKFLVRGGGTVEANAACGAPFNDADNIGLVSQGNFGESPASPNANRWISLGSRPTSTISDLNSYGYRTQWNNYAGDLTVQNQNTSATVKDISLTWQDGLAAVSPTNITYTSPNGLLVQFRNGLGSSGGPIGNLRFTVARYSMLGGTGLFQVNGGVISPTFLNPSDARLKKDINRMGNSLEIIKKLNPVTYDYKADEFGDMGLPRTLQYGFIAQELEKVLPTHVADLDNGYKAVNYTMLIPLLTKGMQETTTQLEQATAKIVTLEQQMNEMLKKNEELINQLDRKGITLQTNGSSISDQFFQNRPNPFSESTTIAYNFIADGNYKLVLTDLTGKLIKQYANLQGKGEVKINKTDLPSAGIYLYSIITENGEIAASKQLILEN